MSDIINETNLINMDRELHVIYHKVNLRYKAINSWEQAVYDIIPEQSTYLRCVLMLMDTSSEFSGKLLLNQIKKLHR